MLITKVYKREGDSHAKMLTTDPKTIKNGGQFTSPSPPTPHFLAGSHTFVLLTQRVPFLRPQQVCEVV